MSSQNLASLVTIRNHLQLLLTTDRVLITKDKVRVYEALRSKLDKMFLEQLLSTYGTDNLTVLTKNPNGHTSGHTSLIKVDEEGITINGGVVVFDPNNEGQLPLDFDAPTTPVKVDDNLLTSADKPAATRNGSSKTEIPTSDDDAKEIAKKLASAKKKLKAKKAGGKGTTFKRDLTEVADEE